MVDHIEKKKRPIRKKALLIFLSIILALAVITLFVYSRYIPMGRVMPNLYAIRNDNNGLPFVNFFLYRTSQGYIAFDAGYDIEQTERAFQRLGILAGDIVAVFITHDDHDHIGALDLFYNATIYAGVIELPHHTRQIMQDGEIIEIGGAFIQAIYTPGHTSGCVVFLLNDTILFAGDLFVNPNFARYDRELQIYHQQRVLEIDGLERIFTGHFNLFRGIWFYRWRFGYY